MDEVRAAGMDLPVAVGIMPVLDRDKCIRYCYALNQSAAVDEILRRSGLFTKSE